MHYNSQQEPLVMPEYGRMLQEMISYALTIDSREERQRCAETIVGVMERLKPGERNNPGYRGKLWNHLAYIAHYELDVDYPVEIIREEKAQGVPPLPYPMTKIRYRHYGHLLDVLLEQASAMDEGEERTALLILAAEQMARSLLQGGGRSVEWEKITADIKEMTGLTLDTELLRGRTIRSTSFRRADNRRSSAKKR